MTETQRIDDTLGETYIADTPTKIKAEVYLESLKVEIPNETLRLTQLAEQANNDKTRKVLFQSETDKIAEEPKVNKATPVKL